MIVVALAALLAAGALATARGMPDATPLERGCATITVTLATAIGLVYALAPFGWIGGWVVAALTLAFAVAVVLRRSRAAHRVPFGPLGRVEWAALLVGAIAVAFAVLSATLLLPWAWDSLGYHLPIVHDALQTGTLRRVPTSVQYVNCYPRLVDVFFVAWRVGLPDDTWIELGQVPFAGGGVVAIATLAERGGVRPGRALAFGALWLAIPVAMLVLAAAYVDVAVASLALLAFTLATMRGSSYAIVVAGLAIGLLLGSKPSAPPIALAAMVALVAAQRDKRAIAVAACGLAVLVGGWKYVENLWVLGNPLWPIELRLGPLRFAGRASMAELAQSGLREPYLSMSLPHRVLASWTAWPRTYVYDMRIGGFGPLFTFGLLPVALGALIALRRPAWRARLRPIALPIALLLASTLASPGAFWARYTLAIPAALLVVAIVAVDALEAHRASIARAVSSALVVLAAFGIAVSWRGFTEDGPSLFEIARMPAGDRIGAYALDREEREWHRARELVQPGEAFGYDPSYGLPGRLWRPDGRGRVAYLEDREPSLEELLGFLRRERVGVVVLGDASAELARAHPEHFREVFRSAYRDWQPCTVFDVRLDGAVRGAR